MPAKGRALTVPSPTRVQASEGWGGITQQTTASNWKGGHESWTEPGVDPSLPGASVSHSPDRRRAGAPRGLRAPRGRAEPEGHSGKEMGTQEGIRAC